MDLITKDFAMNQRADITVNGGSDILRYAVVGSYYGEQGIFERDKSQSWNSGTHLNKFNLRSNVDINITKTTQLTVSVGGYLQEMNKMAISSDDAFREHSRPLHSYIRPIIKKMIISIFQ